MMLSRTLDTWIDIDAPPERVWDVLIDFPAWGEWNTFIPAVKGILEAGAHVSITVVPPGRKPMQFEPEISVVRPYTEIVWGGSFLGTVYRGDHAFMLEALPDGRTRFRQRERFRGPLVLLMGGLIEDTEVGYHQMNQAIKRRAESAVSSPAHVASHSIPTEQVSEGTDAKRPMTAPPASIDLYWIPLGAGGHFVRLNGRVYEAVEAALQHRPRYDLYHSALVVEVPDGRYTIEQTPAGSHAEERGVVGIGPIGAHWLARWHVFRYELRRWRDGVIPDLDEAVDSPQRLTSDPVMARGLLNLVPEVPFFVWGRDELDVGDMWNSNSQIAWLLARIGIDTDLIKPPPGGRAPGWHAGLVAASEHLMWLPESPAAIAAGSVTDQRP